MSIEKKHYVDINLQGNKLVNPTLGTADLSKAGSFGFDAGRIKYYDGTASQDVANLNDLANLADDIAADITAGFISALKFQGAYDVALNSPELEAPAADAVKAGYVYVASSDGEFFTELVKTGDTLIAKVDNPSTLADWIIVQSNIDIATATTAGIVRMGTTEDDMVGLGTTGAVAVTPNMLMTVKTDLQAALALESSRRVTDVNEEETRALAAEAQINTSLGLSNLSTTDNLTANFTNYTILNSLIENSQIEIENKNFIFTNLQNILNNSSSTLISGFNAFFTDLGQKQTNGLLSAEELELKNILFSYYNNSISLAIDLAAYKEANNITDIKLIPNILSTYLSIYQNAQEFSDNILMIKAKYEKLALESETIISGIENISFALPYNGRLNGLANAINDTNLLYAVQYFINLSGQSTFDSIYTDIQNGNSGILSDYENGIVGYYYSLQSEFINILQGGLSSNYSTFIDACYNNNTSLVNTLVNNALISKVITLFNKYNVMFQKLINDNILQITEKNIEDEKFTIIYDSILNTFGVYTGGIFVQTIFDIDTLNGTNTNPIYLTTVPNNFNAITSPTNIENTLYSIFNDFVASLQSSLTNFIGYNELKQVLISGVYANLKYIEGIETLMDSFHSIFEDFNNRVLMARIENNLKVNEIISYSAENVVLVSDSFMLNTSYQGTYDIETLLRSLFESNNHISYWLTAESDYNAGNFGTLSTFQEEKWNALVQLRTDINTAQSNANSLMSISFTGMMDYLTSDAVKFNQLPGIGDFITGVKTVIENYNNTILNIQMREAIAATSTVIELQIADWTAEVNGTYTGTVQHNLNSQFIEFKTYIGLDATEFAGEATDTNTLKLISNVLPSQVVTVKVSK